MNVYVWEGVNRKGENKKGEIEAVDEAAVRNSLRRQGFKSLNIKKKPVDLLEYIPFLKPKVKEKDVVVFARVFSTMISAGLPLIQCLEILAVQEQNKTFARIITALKVDIESGSSLTDALAKYPDVFDEFFLNLVRAGEAGGILDVILARLSAYMEKTMKLKRRVKGAMTYPISVLVISIAVVALLLLKVIPVFQEMFEGMGGALPAPTQLLIDVSEFTQNYFLYLVVIIIAFLYVFKRYYNTDRGRLAVDGLILKAPIFGSLMRKVAVAKFTRTLSTLLTSGVHIVEGLIIVSKTAGNKIVENAIMETRRKISEGKPLSEPLAEAEIFPPMVVQMIAVGEATGALDAMLTKIADFYDDEIDVAVGAMTSLLEPVMMVFLGGIVGGMLIAMYLPIFQLAAVV